MQSPLDPDTAEIVPVRSRRWDLPAAGWLIAIACVAIRVAVSIYSHRTAEDALITLRYSENLASGSGFAYNPGEHVLGTTTPLYTLILATWAWMFGPGTPTILFGKALNILADGTTCLLLTAWLSRAGLPIAGLVAAALFAVDLRAINWDTSLMETGLVTLAGVAALTAFAYRSDHACALALALLCLTRFDGLLLAVILLGGIAYRRKNARFAPLATFLALTLPWAIFATLYFGSPLPTSVQAKFVIYPRYASGAFPHLGQFFSQLTGQPGGLVLAGAFLLGAWLALRQRHPQVRLALLWVAAYMLIFATSKLMLFGWYLVPALPVYLAIAATGLCHAMRSHTRILLVTVAALLFWTGSGVAGLAARLSDIQRNEEMQRLVVGEWLAAHVPPQDSIMVESIGYIGYYSRRPILDAAGLVSPKTLPAYRKQVRCPLLEIIRKFQPKWVLLYKAEYDWVKNEVLLEGRPLGSGYSEVRDWPPLPGEPPGRGFILLTQVGDSGG
jgi:hypothetical protein